VSVGDAVLVAAAGMVCGVLNSIAGGGSLVLFPALVLTGLAPLSANVTNSVATWAGYLGGVAGFRREMAGLRPRLVPLGLAVLAGSTTGCVLLLVTPSDAFEVVVPVLVLVATALTAFQPRIRRRVVDRAAEGASGASRVALGGLFLATIYGGYFGAALGVIILGVLGVTIRESMRELNATKSVLSLIDASVSVVVFGLFGPVQWALVAVAAPTTLLGGFVGAAIARRLDERVLRRAVVVLGLGAAAYLAVRAR
jgi:uncharacterized membrane protein YfcA